MTIRQASAQVACPKCKDSELYLSSSYHEDLCLVFKDNAFSIHQPLGSKIQLTIPIVSEFQRVLFESPFWVCGKCGGNIEPTSITKLARVFLHFWERDRLGVNPNCIVVYQQGPVIGLCKFCDKIAYLNDKYELVCPKCGSKDGICRFVWDPTSEHPAT